MAGSDIFKRPSSTRAVKIYQRPEAEQNHSCKILVGQGRCKVICRQDEAGLLAHPSVVLGIDTAFLALGTGWRVEG